MTPAAPIPEKIPVPWSRRFDIARDHGLPGFIFVLTALLVSSLWTRHVRPIQIVGEAAGPAFQLRAPLDGHVRLQPLSLFDTVQTGTPLLHIQPGDADILRKELTVLQSELDTLLQSGLPASPALSTRFDLEELRTDLLRARTALAGDRLDLEFLQQRYRREARLFEEQIISDVRIEETRTRRDQARLRVGEGEQLVSSLTTALTDLEPFALSPDSLQRVYQAEIRTLEQRLEVIEARIAAVRLYSPLEGQISTLHVRDGEFVSRGDPLLSIRASRADHIIAHLPQPLRRIPEAGDAVILYSRARSLRVEGTITHIGPGLSASSAAAAPLTAAQATKSLPLRIQPASGHDFLPGEYIEVRWSSP